MGIDLGGEMGKWKQKDALKRNPFLKAIEIKDDDQLDEFRQKALRLIGVDFPLSYLKQGMVRGFLNSSNEIVGGYALVTSGPFRTVRSLPDKSYLTYKENELFEVTALFIDKSVKQCSLRTFFWFHFAKDVFSIKNKKYYIYAYGLYNKKLRNLYSKARPDIIYRGPVKMLEGNIKEERESIEVAKVSTMRFFPFLALPSVTKRMLYSQNSFVKNLKPVQVIASKL